MKYVQPSSCKIKKKKSWGFLIQRPLWKLETYEEVNYAEVDGDAGLLGLVDSTMTIMYVNNQLEQNQLNIIIQVFQFINFSFRGIRTSMDQ